MKQHNEIINDTYTLSASQVIYGAYVKKTKLRELVYDTYGNSSIAEATKLNIYIDLTSILHPLYSEHNRITIENMTDISAGIINMCAHYRSFFREELGVDTRIFLINSLNICDINKKFVGTYNQVFEEKTKITDGKKLIDNNLKLLKALCPYLPAIYYVDSVQQFETAVLIAHIIELLHDENPNLIISHDMYPLQLCAQYRWTSYLYPFKTRNKLTKMSEDLSWMIPVNDKPNFREEFWTNYTKARKLQGSALYRISPINFPLILAMVMLPERGLNAILRIPKAVEMIYSVVGGEDIRIDQSQLESNPAFADLPFAQIAARYKACDVQFMLPFYRATPEATQINFLDLDNIAAVNNIVAKYYANNPIDLFKL